MLEKLLYSKDEVVTYKEIQKLEHDAEESNVLYKNMNLFIKMLKSNKSYIRLRALKFISINSKWDKNNIIYNNIKIIFPLLKDKKAIVSRECVKTLKNIISNKPELKKLIITELKKTDTTIYNESMSNLINREIKEVINNG